MERILIIGGNGAGKTTFAKALAAKLDLPLTHLDTLYWRDNWEPAPKEEFDSLLLRELKKPKWILDGNMSRTMPLRLSCCDTVIFMDFPRIACVSGILLRTLQSHGESRADMGGHCSERFDRQKLSFLKDVWRSHKKNRMRYYAMLRDAGVAEVVVLKSRRQAEAFLQGLARQRNMDSE